MNIVESLHSSIDMPRAKKQLLILSAVILALIPIDGLRVFVAGVKPAKPNMQAQVKPLKSIESQESYLAHFERSALFGAAGLGAGAPALQANLAEIAKDYRLQGVLISDDPEAIVQDAKTQKTMFVKKGELLGKLTVSEIKEGAIILSYMSQEFKLEIQ